MNVAGEQAGNMKREDGRTNDKCQFICGFLDVVFNEFICMVYSQLCFFRLILKGPCTSLFVRCALFTDSTKNKQH